MDLPDENKHLFVAILNKKIEIGRFMNALGHMTAGLAGGSGKAAEMWFLQYKDKDGGRSKKQQLKLPKIVSNIMTFVFSVRPKLCVNLPKNFSCCGEKSLNII